MDPIPNSRAWRSSAHVALVAGALTILSVPAAPAYAHAILVESSPKANETLSGPEVAFDLRYNSRIDQKRSRLTLKGPDGRRTILPIAPESAVDHLKTHATGLASGSYTLRWQVLATDGHITRGDVPFSIAIAPPAAASH